MNQASLGYEAEGRGPFFRRAFQIDLGRQIERPEALLRWLPRYAEWGYTTLVLYLENAFRFRRHPKLAGRFAYTRRDIERIIAACARLRMDVIPVIPSLGHGSYILAHPEYQYLSETRAEKEKNGGQLCPSLAATCRVLGEMYDDWFDLATAGIIHVGLDESPTFGRCRLCKPWMERRGEGDIFLTHLARLNDLVKARGKRLALWGDMFYYYPEIIPQIPKDAIVFDWFYYPFRRRPRIESFNFRDVDSAGLLRKQGLSVWGCPNNNTFMNELYPDFELRLNNIRDWARYGAATGCDGLCVTSWSPNLSSWEYAVLVDAAAAPLLQGQLGLANEELMARGLRAVYGRAAGRLARAALELGRVTNSGYHTRNHYTNDWRRLVRFAADPEETRALSVVRGIGRRFPAAYFALHAARILREYYAAKSMAIYEASRSLVRAGRMVARGLPDKSVPDLKKAAASLRVLEPLLGAALTASRRLWRRYRHPADKNRMAAMLLADRRVLDREMRRLQMCARNPRRLTAMGTFVPPAILQIETVNCRPALQGVVIAISRDQGRTWTGRTSCWLLEFSERSCYPTSKVRRLHSVPLDSADPDLLVKIRVSGYGCLGLRLCRWTNGAKIINPAAVTRTRGRIVNAGGLLRPGGGMTRLGDDDPEAQFNDLRRRRVEHSITLRFKKGTRSQRVTHAK